MGLCAPADGESEHSCDTLREKASLFGKVTDCNYSSCDGNQCNGFKTVLLGNNTHNCSALKDENGELFCYLFPQASDFGKEKVPLNIYKKK